MKKIFKISSYVAFLYLLVFDLNVNQILTFNNEAVKMTNTIVVPEAVAKELPIGGWYLYYCGPVHAFCNYTTDGEFRFYYWGITI